MTFLILSLSGLIITITLDTYRKRKHYLQTSQPAKSVQE